VIAFAKAVDGRITVASSSAVRCASAFPAGTMIAVVADSANGAPVPATTDTGSGTM